MAAEDWQLAVLTSSLSLELTETPPPLPPLNRTGKVTLMSAIQSDAEQAQSTSSMVRRSQSQGQSGGVVFDDESDESDDCGSRLPAPRRRREPRQLTDIEKTSQEIAYLLNVAAAVKAQISTKRKVLAVN